MSDAAALGQALRESRPARLSRASRGFKGHPMVQLTLVRFREFIREPEAVFWTFVFPILLAAGLGIAFRQRGAEQMQIGVVERPGADTSVLAAIKRDSTLITRSLDDSAGALALRTGKIALLVIPGSSRDSVRYVFDRGRSEAVNARVVVDRAIQSGAGRVDLVHASDTYVTETGSRYIDFLLPGLLGMNLMGSSIWSLGFAIVTARSKKLLKRLMATPMSRVQYLLSFLASRMFFLIIEVVTLLGFGHLAFGVRRSSPRITRCSAAHCRARRRVIRWLGTSRRLAGEDCRGSIWNHELHHASDVGLFGRFLFVVELPRSRAAVHSPTPAHGGERCAPRQHARGRLAGRGIPPVTDHHGLGGRHLFRGTQAVPLALIE